MPSTTKTLALPLLLLLPNLSWAQILYAPAEPGAAVPTLSATMLVFLVTLIMAATRIFGVKRGSGGKLLGMLLVCAVASGALSVKLVSDVYADGNGGGTSIGFLDSPVGGSVPIDEDELNIFENTSGVPQEIIDVIVNSCPNTDSGLIDGVSRCDIGSVVSTGEDGLCYTDCRPEET